MPPKILHPTQAPTYASVMKSIDIQCHPQDRTRMIARLLEHQTLDTWMTYELMEAAIKWVEKRKPNDIDWTLSETVQTRDQQSSTTADLLGLIDTPADSFYNFQGIKVNGAGDAMRHINRPDGMFEVTLQTTNHGPEKMVLFYEGEAHGKDVGKSLDSGCKNSHKMYQAIVQAQSKNEYLAGCAIFAAMEYAPIDQVIPFLDDMYKAHIFICIAIADWNSHIYEKRRKATLIGDLFRNSLEYKTDYDFVFGINIGLKAGTASWDEIEVRDRINKMRTVLGHVLVGDNIALAGELEDVAEFYKTSTAIGCVQIVVCAIPRPKRDILTNGNIRPMFIYPNVLQDKVEFDRQKNANHGVNEFTRVLANSGNCLPAGVGYFFKTNMMRVTAVYTVALAEPDVHKCRLSETTGFFYVALPLAYYTIQQFEFVNAVLDYSWSPTKKDFRLMLRTLKANKKNLTGDLNVTLFAKKKGSLFQVICKSADDLEPLSEDFDFFLKDCCRWSDPDPMKRVLKGSSPKIVFRTLGIFSLQNAIDFACEVQANPSKTYSSLLASYPVGAQMLIQQCMKKLSGNEAYAYIGRNALSDKEIRKMEDVREEEEERNFVLRAEAAVIKFFHHSSWHVTFGAREAVVDADAPVPENVAAAPATAAASRKKEREDVLALKLLKAYQKDVVCWTCKALPMDQVRPATIAPGDHTWGEDPLPRLLVLWTDCLTKRQLWGGRTDTIVLPVPASLYEPEVSYGVACSPHAQRITVDYVCTPVCIDSLWYSSKDDISDDIGTEYKTKWGRTPITFKLISPNVPAAAMQGVLSAADNAFKYIEEFLLENGEGAETTDATIQRIKERRDRAAAAVVADAQVADAQALLVRSEAEEFRLWKANRDAAVAQPAANAP